MLLIVKISSESSKLNQPFKPLPNTNKPKLAVYLSFSIHYLRCILYNLDKLLDTFLENYRVDKANLVPRDFSLALERGEIKPAF